MDQQQLVNTQFGNTTKNYLTSNVHASGADLDRLSGLASKLRPARVLDLGCGAGHASFALASGGASDVIAYDLSGQMLAVVADEAQARNPGRIRTRQGRVEALPFADAGFDLVVTRYSAHHWLDIDKAMSEIARVTAPGGTLVVIDSVSPEAPLYDTALQTVELLRDASHVRNYRVSEWLAMLARARFAGAMHDQWKVPLDFESWVTRISTPFERIAALRATFAALSGEARRYFSVGEDCSFSIDTAWIQASRVAR